MTLIRSGTSVMRIAALAALFAAVTFAGAAKAESLLPRLAGTERIHVAQSAESAQLALRIQQLEEQIRMLTGQVEGLTFQLTQMQTLVQRMTEDYEFRFQQIEGGAPAQPATPSDGAALPTQPADEPAVADLVPLDQPMDQVPTVIDPEFEGFTLDGDSLDPLIGGEGFGQTGTLGTLDGTDLALPTTTTGDADAQYRAGYDALMRGDYTFAEDQFGQFIALYPDSPQAPDATSWLGEALIQRGAYDDAALILAEGYQKYAASERAPDLMLKLGIALHGAGEAEVACRTYATLESRFSNLAPAFRQRLEEEKARAQCPA